MTSHDNVTDIEKRLRPEDARTRRFEAATVRCDLLTEAADHIETLQARVTALEYRWIMIEKLRAEEGHSVELIHDNPDFGGPNCVVHVSTDYGQNHDAYYGDTIDDCLQKAVEALEAKNDQVE